MRNLQFKIGFALIITSVIWTFSKFGIIQVDDKSILSLVVISVSLAMFNHFFNTNHKYFTLVSIVIFFTGIYLYVLSIENRSSIIFSQSISFMTYVFVFSLATFFLIEMMNEGKKISYLMIGLSLYLLGGVVILFNSFNLFFNPIVQSKIFIFLQRLVLSLLLLSIIFQLLKKLVDYLRRLELLSTLSNLESKNREVKDSNFQD